MMDLVTSVGEPMPLKKARPILKKLNALATELNEASDTYTNELREIERELGELNLGLTVTLRKPIYEGDWYDAFDAAGEEIIGRERKASRLSYGKYQPANRWCFLVLDYFVSGPTHEFNEIWKLQDEKPLLECSRDIRINAADAVEDLLEQIEKEAKAKSKLLRKGIGS